MVHFNKEKVSSIFLVLSVFLLMMGLYRFLYLSDNKYTAGAPYGADGVFAVTQEDLSSGTPLLLIDGWELYLDQAYSPDDFAAGLSGQPLEVFIGQYSNYSYIQNGHSPFGTATYRLLLAYDGAPRPLTLEIPELFTDYTLWIDGMQSAVNGSGRSVTFIADESTELVLNIENHTHYYSGMTYPPALGTPEAMDRLLAIRTLFYAMLSLCPLTLAIFCGVLWMSRERGLLPAFGLLCCCYSLSCLHPFIWQWGLSGTIWYALEDTSRMAMLAATVIICSEVAGFRGRGFYVHGLRPAMAVCCIGCAVSVILIIPFFPNFINGYSVLISSIELLTWLYLIVCAALGLSRKAAGSRFVLAGGIVLGTGFMINLADANRFEPIFTGWQTEYAGFLLVLIFGGLMIARNRDILLKNRQLMLHMEDMVQQRTAELHHILDERKAFFSDLAHNLKAPIAAIHVFINMMQESNLYLDGELSEYLTLIKSENLEMQQRVQSLRTLNAFDRIQSLTEPIDIDELLAQVQTGNAPEADASGIYFEVGRLDMAADVIGQREKLLTLFENLIYNALSFTPPDGHITIMPHVEDSLVVIEVADTGCGIAADRLPHIFERFYVGRDNKDEGSGLGLYIAKLVADEMGGTITTASEPGQGTTFTLRLPLSVPKKTPGV